MTNPFNYRITSPYGVARTYVVNGVTYNDVHDGIDFAYPQGTPVTLPPGGAWDGVVTYAGKDQYGGNYVDVKADVDGGVGRFIHFSRIDVKVGDRVVSNQQLGLSGGAKGTDGAGLSTGAHLHIGLLVNNRAVDPTPWLKKAYIVDPEPQSKTLTQVQIEFIQGGGGSPESKQLLVDALLSGDMVYYQKYYPNWLLEVEAERKTVTKLQHMENKPLDTKPSLVDGEGQRIGSGRPFGVSKKLTALLATDTAIGAQLVTLMTQQPELFTYPIAGFELGELLIGCLIGINAGYILIQGIADIIKSI